MRHMDDAGMDLSLYGSLRQVQSEIYRQKRRFV